MGHPPRVFTPGESVHVIRRGINRSAIVCADVDRRVLLRVLETAAGAADVSVHGFTLMTNHYHLIVTPHSAPSLPAMMKQVGEEYVRYFNRKYGRIGTLWTGRYRGIDVGDDKYWLTCLRYVEQNAWRAGMVSTPDAYPWSSYRVHAFGESSEWLELHHIYLGLGRTPEDRQRAYRAICGVPIADDELARLRTNRRKVKCHQSSGV